ncbi:MAG: DUF2851 family protein [Candidatus Neomarinimicrobiota bacterium]
MAGGTGRRPMMRYSIPEWSGDSHDGLISEPEQERTLVDQWLRLPPGTRLTDTNGATIMVLAPGRHNRHAGPDISGARIFRHGEFISGAVECHRTAMDWWHHRHQSDTNYSPVILHVVRQWRPSVPILPFPTVVLKPELPHPPGCRLSSRSEIAQQQLRNLGRRRWQEKVEQFISLTDDSTTAGTGIIRRALEACGYGGNRETFGRLADRILPRLYPGQTFAILLTELQRLAALPELQWQRCSVRPANRIENRLPAAAHLLEFLLSVAVLSRSDDRAFQAALDRQLKPAIGPGLLVELLGNVFYPWLGARALVRRDFILLAHWQASWERLRLPGTYGVLQRRFGHLFATADLKNFCFAQGGLMVVKRYCRSGGCARCPLPAVSSDA